MQSILGNPYLILIARLVVGGIFVMYGVDKIVTPKDFAHSLMAYEMLPNIAVNLMALIMPWLEVICGLMLILGVRLRAASLLSSAMLVVFIMAILTAMARSLNINCGCSAHAETVGWAKVLEDTGYLILAMLVYFYPNKKFTLEAFVANQPQQNLTTEEEMGFER